MQWIWRYLHVIYAALWLGTGFAPSSTFAGEPTSEEFRPIAQEVLSLLQNRDKARFIEKFAPTRADYEAICATNSPIVMRNPNFAQETADAYRKVFEDSVNRFLDRADYLHLEFPKTNLEITVVAPFLQQPPWKDWAVENAGVKYAENVEFVIKPASLPSGTNSEFKLRMTWLVKFPTGWRCIQRIEWVHFPPSVSQARAVQEAALLSKATHFEGFSIADDPSLRPFSEKLIEFVRARDLGRFENDLYLDKELVWELFQQANRKNTPSSSFRSAFDLKRRMEFNREMDVQLQEQRLIASKALQFMTNSGIDLSDVQITIEDAAVERSSPPKPSSLGLEGENFSLVLRVQTERKAMNGTPLAGKYALGAKHIIRMDDQWVIERGLHWISMPDGVMDTNTAVAVEFEAMIAKWGVLPWGMAPDIQIQDLKTKKPLKLSDFRGKVVLLDFWATWCGPCQPVMAELQKLKLSHPEWRDKVAILSISIDDKAETALAHIQKRGWTNTFNLWAGEGGWHSESAKTFRLIKVPTNYILDQQGKIISSKRRQDMIEEDINFLLGIKTP